MQEGEKISLMREIYTNFAMDMTMIFVNKKDTAKALQEQLKQLNISAEILIGGDHMDKAQRDQLIDNFRCSKFSTLISTNVLARGIDVPEVDLVINYDVPYISQFGFKNPDYANYLHRVGRTGRFGTDGLALTMCTDEVEIDLI